MSFSSKIRTMKSIIKGARNALIAKGETVTYDDDIPQIIEDMSGGGADTEYLKAMIERPSNARVVIPSEATKIGAYAFYGFANLSSITIPSQISEIGKYAFSISGITNINIPSTVTVLGENMINNCSNITTVTINSSTTGDSMLMSCPNLLSITLGNTVTRIKDRLVAGCNKLTSLYIPASVTRVDSGMGTVYNCPNLEYVTIENGFNANGLDLACSGSTKFSVDTIISWLNALADRTGDTAYTLRIGSTNLAKLSAAEIAIATNKNWNLA